MYLFQTHQLFQGFPPALDNSSYSSITLPLLHAIGGPAPYGNRAPSMPVPQLLYEFPSISKQCLPMGVPKQCIIAIQERQILSAVPPMAGAVWK
jgi:hypothetical protein